MERERERKEKLIIDCFVLIKKYRSLNFKFKSLNLYY